MNKRRSPLLRRLPGGSSAYSWRLLIGLTLLFGMASWRIAEKPAQAAVRITGLHVSGNQILNSDNQALVLHGVDRAGTEYACIQNWGIFDGPSDAASVQAIAAWHTNAVRVPLNEDCWLGINGAPGAYSGSAYQNAIAAYVNLLNQNGLVAILDLHWTAAGSGQSTNQQQMADADHAPAFWTSVATAFKGNSSVIFDLFNEPHDISWSCWRDGGANCGTGYTVAGMQSLVNAVRGTGATNLIMAGGLAYANDLSQWLAYRPTDPQHNLVAAWHVYNFNACANTSCYDSNIAPVAQQVPLVAGEIGENDCAHGFIDALMGWLDTHQSGYIGWSWNTYDCGSFPSLISNYDGTPSAFGIGLRDHLAALGGGSTPTPVPTATPVIATRTPTSTATAPSPTATRTPSPIVTRVAATATATRTATPIAVASATRTPTHVAPASPTQTASPSPSTGGNVVVGASVSSGSGPYWGEEDVTISNSAPLTALSVSVSVQKTAGVSFAGQYNTFPGGAINSDHSTGTSVVTYSYTLAPGQIVPTGHWMLGSQFSGTGTPHPTAGDTYTVTSTSGGSNQSVSGHF